MKYVNGSGRPRGRAWWILMALAFMASACIGVESTAPAPDDPLEAIEPAPSKAAAAGSEATPTNNGSAERLADRTIMVTVVNAARQPVEGAYLKAEFGFEERWVVFSGVSDRDGLVVVTLNDTVLRKALENERRSYATLENEPIFEDLMLQIEVIDEGDVGGAPSFAHASYSLITPDIGRIADMTGEPIEKVKADHDSSVGSGIESFELMVEMMTPVLETSVPGAATP